MTRSPWHWLQRAGGSASGLLPGADDFLLFTKRGKQVLDRFPHFKWGVKNVAGPVGVGLKLHWVYTNRSALLSEAQKASQRTLDVLTPYEAPEDAWHNTPKYRWNARKAHGFFVNPRDRMVRNPPMASSQELLQRERERYS